MKNLLLFLLTLLSLASFAQSESDALPLPDSLVGRLRENRKTDVKRAEALDAVILFYGERNRILEAQSYIQELESLSEELKDNYWKAMTLFYKGQCAYYNYAFSEFLSLTNEAFQMAEKLRDTKRTRLLMAKIFLAKSAYFNYSQQFSECQECIEKGLEIAENNGFERVRNKLVNNYGILLMEMGQYEKSIVTNSKIGDPTNFEPGVKTIYFPTVYEWFYLYGATDYDDYISTTMYFDAEGNVVREAMPLFREGVNPKPASWPIYFPETPAKTVMPSDKITFFGERTPLATYYPRAFNAGNTPLNQTFFNGGFYFSGEQSCERTSDYDAFIQIYVDGQEVYNDSICKFNKYWVNIQPATPGDVVVEVNNHHLIANEVTKVNKTHVEFSLRNDDAMPPTMTFLRVLDGNGDENIWHDNLPLSTLVFGCADFSYHFNEELSSYDYLEYNAKPEVELLYSLDGEIWEPLAFTEDESLFHIEYGNVFVANLGQLESRAINQWVSLKFVLTDAAGNTQTQTLENVFYAGEMISVGEHATMQHQVYPNPFNGEVKITSSEAVNGNAIFNVYNVLGAQVYHQTMNCANTTEFVWDGSQVSPGIYFYSISTENGVLQGKIIKE